jgi:ABC-type transport system involved in multi-copper enzyme maturation permease subunit
LLCSVYARRSIEALLLSYVLIALYLALSLAAREVLTSPQLGREPLLGYGGSYTLADLGQWLCAGNLPVLVSRMSPGTARELAPRLLTMYGAFHILLAAVCIPWAATRLRRVARRQAAGTTRKQRKQAARRVLPPVGDWPVLWKDWQLRSGSWFLTAIVVVWATGTWLLRILNELSTQFNSGLYRFLLEPEMPVATVQWFKTADELHYWVVVPVLGLTSLLFLLVAIRAASSVSDERAKQTLDGLLTTPLSSRAILIQKALACLLSTRGAWWWLMLLVAVGVRVGAISGAVVPLAVAATALFAVFFTMLGLWFSIYCRTTVAAMAATLAVAGTLLAAPWLLAAQLPSSVLANLPKEITVDGRGLWPYPLGTLYFLVSLKPTYYRPLRAPSELAGVLFGFGALLYALSTFVLWGTALPRFRARSRPLDQQPTPQKKPAPATSGREPWDIVPTLDVLKLFLPAFLLRRGCWVCAATLGAILWIGTLGLHAHLDRRLQAVEREIDRLDPGWRLMEMQARGPRIPDAENGAMAVERIVDVLSSDFGFIDRFGPGFIWNMVLATNPVDPFAPVDVSRVRASLTPLSDLRREARAVLNYARGRYPIEDAHSVAQSPCKCDLEAFVYFVCQDAMLRIHDGDTPGALTDCRVILHAGRLVGEHLDPRYQMTRLAGWFAAARLLERALAQGPATEAELHALQQLLEAEAAEPLELYLFRAERAWLHDRCSAAESRKLDVFHAPSLPSVTHEMDVVASATLKLEHAGMLDYLTRHIEVLRLPRAEQDAARRHVVQELKENGLVGWQFGELRQSLTISERLMLARAKLHSAIAAVAAKRYQLAHGELPTDLGQLVPHWLSSVPFRDGPPLLMTRSGNRVMIYSVVTNGRVEYGAVRTRSLGPVEVGIYLSDTSRRSPASSKVR